MDKKAFLNSSKREKDFALLVGVMVACAHFLITVIMIPLSEDYDSLMKYLVGLIITALIAPSVAPILVIFDSWPIALPPLDSFSPFLVLVIAYSSAFYGITGGFLVSNKKILQRLGMVFIGLLVLLNCLILVVLF